MCGIYGFVGLNDSQVLKRMGDALVHRGPDDRGEYIGDSASLGNTRLSIVGLSTGKQPIYNENRTMAVVANCEIYNFRELKQELEKKGHRFYTDCDTEVIVHMYEEYGKDAPKHLNGDFAFAIWDEEKKELFLARDHFGINPLFYTVVGSNIFFASEIKALLEAGIKRELDLSAFNRYLTYTYSPGKDTLVKGIYKLLPGEFLFATNKSATVEKYWEVPEYLQNHLNETELIERVKRAVTIGVKNRMMADVPLGIYLSDGIDSNIVASIASRNSEKSLHAYSILMPGVDAEKINISASQFNLKHKFIELKKEHLFMLPKIVNHLDCLTGDPTAVANYLLSQEARKDVKTVLTGEGSDELFYGYDFFRRFANSSQDTMHDRPEKKYFRFISMLRDDFSEAEKEKLLKNYSFQDPHSNIRMHFTRDEDSRDQVSRFLINNFLPHALLNRLNNTSLANSVEGRVPFLDMVTSTTALRDVPAYMKLNQNVEKWILKKAFREMLPPQYADIKKKPFAVNLEEVYGRELTNELVKNMEENGLFREVINKDFVLKTIEKNSRVKMYSRQLWSLLVFSHWHNNFILNKKTI